MTTATRTTKSRKPAAKPARRVHLYNAASNPMLVELTVGAEAFDYFVKRIRADFGMGFEFTKLVHGEPCAETYHVHFDPARKLSTCDCKGGSYNGHCKHQEAIVALIQSGKLPVPAPRQAEAKAEAKPAADCCPCCGALTQCNCFDDP